MLITARRVSSPIPGVPDPAWATLVSALEVQPVQAVSRQGGFGAYDLRPRRLSELGYRCGTRAKDKTAQPFPQRRFLNDPLLQYQLVEQSLTQYHRELTSGVLEKPADVSMAGALAILHRGGRGALQSWPNLFEHTRERYEAARGAF